MLGGVPAYKEREVRSQYGAVLRTQVLYWRMQCTSHRVTVLYMTVSCEDPPFDETATKDIKDSARSSQACSGSLGGVLFSGAKFAPRRLITPRVVIICQALLSSLGSE